MINVGKRVQQAHLTAAIFQKGHEYNVIMPDGRKGWVCSVERESGSGKTFNVTVRFELEPGKSPTYTETIFIAVS